MSSDRASLPVPDIATIASDRYADSDEAASAATRTEQAHWVLTLDDRGAALRFWKDVAGMWPKKWWSLRQHRQDFQLRLYAKRLIRELERQTKPNALKTSSKRSKPVAAVALALLAATPARALGVEAIPNWPAPASWSPSRSRGVTTQADISNPLPFIAVTPCRQYDSRNVSALTDNTNRGVTLTGAPCGIPTSAAAVSVNITIFSITGAGGNGVFQVGTVTNPTFSWINYPPTETQRGNAGVVPVNGSGQIFVKANQGGGSLHFTVDVNGYYAQSSPNTFTFEWDTDAGAIAVIGHNSRPLGGTVGVWGESDSSGTGSIGVLGTSNSGAPTYGVVGFGGVGPNAAGVRGVDGSGSPPNVIHGQVGVRGESLNIGVLGASESVAVLGDGMNGSGGLLARGLLGVSNGGANPLGVYGLSFVAGQNSAGVFGVDGTGAVGANRDSAGVRGEGAGSFGVLGLSRYIGVVGSLYNTGGGLVAEGFLGSSFGVNSNPNIGPPWGVFAYGQIGATSAKYFVEPHPTDPNKVILYACLEGREVGTYFRGTARTSHGKAFIEVPEDFRIVTDEDGLTVQLTAIGAPPTMYVASKDLQRIEVRSEKDLDFDYLVQGVRRAFKGFEPVANGMEFAPRSPEDRMPLYLTDEARRRLIANGTYNPDGTVNMQTAERVGWTQVWKEREERNKAAAATLAKSR
jgi:hypothetical protein